MYELLAPAEMAEADRLTIERGPHDGYRLMQNAGAAITAEILKRFADAPAVDVLCGPGNNGGDGYVVARLLVQRGVPVRLWREAPPRAGTEAERAARDCPVEPRPLSDFRPERGALVVDALFGAGLSKAVHGVYAEAIGRVSGAGSKVIAVDLPSGIAGESGKVLGSAFHAALTVTFFRRKPGHLVIPGRAHCGTTVVADIGIRDDVLADIKPATVENVPAWWVGRFPVPAVDTHKYRRGHVGVFSGGPSATGAARMAATGAARAGAGAVTLLSPANALAVNAGHVTAVMLARIDGADDLAAFVAARKASAFVLGPGFGAGERAREFALRILAGEGRGLVLDADGITSFRDMPDALFSAAARERAPALVLTPHVGEFARLFPDLAGDEGLSKIERARQASARANAVVVLKGADTVIAASDGRAAVNANATPWLATAGSGDVLAGIICAFVAQGMPAFEAACAGAWLHAEAGRRFGPGLIAEDLPAMLPGIVAELVPAARTGSTE